MAKALGDDVDLDADLPRIEAAGVMTAISSPATSTTAAETAAAMRAARLPATASRGGACGRGGTAGSSSRGGSSEMSFKWLPLASLAANGYHLTPMDARVC